jgi:hypothetical protein
MFDLDLDFDLGLDDAFDQMGDPFGGFGGTDLGGGGMPGACRGLLVC